MFENIFVIVNFIFNSSFLDLPQGLLQWNFILVNLIEIFLRVLTSSARQLQLFLFLLKSLIIVVVPLHDFYRGNFKQTLLLFLTLRNNLRLVQQGKSQIIFFNWLGLLNFFSFNFKYRLFAIILRSRGSHVSQSRSLYLTVLFNFKGVAPRKITRSHLGPRRFVWYGYLVCMRLLIVASWLSF